MSSALYLRSVELSNFRIYGDSYAFEFPPGPGVTLITGGNGLGKTSFFDGVEWALTDQVGRFKDIPVDGRRKSVDPLTRIGVSDKSHRVSLQFSDGSVIDRGAGFEADKSLIVRLLKRPEWAEISSLHGYLSITHFFGQASAQRFSLKKPTDQWEALKGPAGVDRINSLRERMSGLGVKRAFTRAIEDKSAKLEQARVALVAWNQLIEDRDRARQLASSEHAIAPSELRVEANELASQVAAATGRNSLFLSSRTDAPEAMLGQVSALLHAALERAGAESKRVEELTRHLGVFESARSESLALGTQVEAAEARLASAREELKQVDAKLVEAVETLRASELDASHAQNRLVTLNRVTTSAKQLAEAHVRQSLLQAQLIASESAAAEAAARCAQLQKQQTGALRQRSERRALADRVSLARMRSQISASLTDIQAEISRVLQLISDRNTAELRRKRAALLLEAAAANEQAAVLVSELRKQDDRSQAITEAVTEIAHRLSQHDTFCPVCMTEFAPGRLLELVRSHQAAGPPQALDLATTLANVRLTAELCDRQVSEADVELADAARLESSLAMYRSRETEFRQQLVESGGAADGKYDDSGIIKLERELQLLDNALAEVVPPEVLAVQISEAETAIKAEATKRASIQQLQAAASDEAQACRSTLLPHPDLSSPDGVILVDLEVVQETTEQIVRDAGERVSAAKGRLAEVQTARDVIQAAETREIGVLGALNTSLRALSSALREARRRWTEAGQVGEPDASRLASYRQLMTDGIDRLKALDAALDRLIHGYKKWLHDEQLRKLEQEVSDKVTIAQVGSELECQAELSARVEQAGKELTLAQEARSKVDEVGARMQELSKRYADGVLVPLNATIKRFAKTLMTWSDTAVNYKAEHLASRTELRPNIVRNELDGTVNQVDINPSLYFSEGQLSALSIAALFAASTTFGWSRWRSLLLDDPLQHNDVIHASAFMDLLRQMVLSLGYQIILSTHDSAEAEFLIRKCRNAGIPHRVHELIPGGASGLVNSDALTARVSQG